MARFQFFFESQTDRQNRLLNPASRMRARGNYDVVQPGFFAESFLINAHLFAGHVPLTIVALAM